MMPPGVIALQPCRTRQSIFWVHYLCTNLAEAIGDDLPFLFVGLVAEDLPSLGKTPTFKSIAGCIVQKILATPTEGPYTIGGYCLGGILAYEIASQLRTAGHEVSLLVLLDPPTPSSLASRHPLSPRLSQPSYLVKRVTRLGLRKTLEKLSGRVLEHFPRSVRTRFVKPEMNIGQQIIEAAASTYKPEKYEGKALLLLADDHPPHVNFLPEWKSLVPCDLHADYIDAHHSELTKEPNARKVADNIVSHLQSIDEDVSFSRSA